VRHDESLVYGAIKTVVVENVNAVRLA
jgi:hypothetical protein